MHNELVAEGITDIHFMGMNGFQYINDSNGCMLCEQPELCSNCEDTHHLPWTQDYDDGFNCTGANDGLCEADDTLGDVNLDGVVNVLDIVQNVNYILGDLDFTEEQLVQADFNQDGGVNILDIVQAVNYILSGGIQYMPKFMAEDINPNSEYFGQVIGPDTFTGDISCYYFGKAG